MTDAELFMKMRASFKQSEAFVEAAADRIEAQAAEIERLRDALAKAMDGLKECEKEIDAYIQYEYPHDHPIQERCRQRDYAANPARTTLAELTGDQP